MSDDHPTYAYVTTTFVPPLPKLGDRRVRNIRVPKGRVYTRKRDDGSKYEFTLTRDVYMDVEEEYTGANADECRYRPEWVEVVGRLQTAVPVPTRWERFKQWLGHTPRIPTARLIKDEQ